MDVKGDELKTVSFPPATRHSARKDATYLANPPLASTMGMNQASRASDKDAMPRATCFLGNFARENTNRGPRKRRNDGRIPAPNPKTTPAGTTNRRLPR